MASAADCNAGSKIQEAITVNVPDFDTAPMRHHEWVLARIRGRHYLGIARQDCPRFGSGQLGSDGGIAIGTLVHRLTCPAAARGIVLDRRASPAWAIAVRLCRSRRTRNSSAVGAATTSIVSASTKRQPVDERILSTLTFAERPTRACCCDLVDGLRIPMSVS